MHSVQQDRLDQRVGETVLLDVERGGQAVEGNIGGGDLHAISPASYLEVGGGVLAPLSYHAARNRGVPVEGVSVSAPGYMFYHAGVPKGAVITHIDAEPVSTLDDVERVLAAVALALVERVDDDELPPLIASGRRHHGERLHQQLVD